MPRCLEYFYFLQRFLPDLSPQATALSLAQISRLPLCLNLPGSTLSEVLARCAAARLFYKRTKIKEKVAPAQDQPS